MSTPTINTPTPATTQSSLAERGMADSPPLYPYGWYAVAFVDEIRPGSVVTRKFMGRDIILFRTGSGALCAAEAYCPHLGAHLGHGGKVHGESIECPFHGFRFGVDGACTSTPYEGGTPPPAARLGLLPSRESFGNLMVYHGEGGEPPWELEIPSDDGGWRPLQRHMMLFRSHPQEMTENSVDYGHFGGVHDMHEFKVVSPLVIDGPRLRVTYSAVKSLPFGRGLPGTFDIRVDGLGHSIVEVKLKYGWLFRQIVLATPTEGRELDVFFSISVRRAKGSRLKAAMLAPVQRLFGWVVLRAIVIELSNDQKMWDHKKYLSRPALAGGDGPIGKYRRWAKQFYPTDA